MPGIWNYHLPNFLLLCMYLACDLTCLLTCHLVLRKIDPIDRLISVKTYSMSNGMSNCMPNTCPMTNKIIKSACQMTKINSWHANLRYFLQAFFKRWCQITCQMATLCFTRTFCLCQKIHLEVKNPNENRAQFMWKFQEIFSRKTNICVHNTVG
jgi:hypothetical protein